MNQTRTGIDSLFSGKVHYIKFITLITRDTSNQEQ